MAERRDLPLFAWGQAAQAARPHRGRRRLRIVCTALGGLCVLGTAMRHPAPRLVWNASASAPVGLYSVTPGALLRRGDMVVAWTPAAVRMLAAARHYIPVGVPLVKRVAAVAGDRVCAHGPVVTIGGHFVTARRGTDRSGRRLPWWEGCRTLPAGSVFLLMAGVGTSFDGRYFGPTPASDVLGKARLLWAR